MLNFQYNKKCNIYSIMQCVWAQRQFYIYAYFILLFTEGRSNKHYHQTESQNIPSWDGLTKIESNAWLLAGLPKKKKKNQAMFMSSWSKCFLNSSRHGDSARPPSQWRIFSQQALVKYTDIYIDIYIEKYIVLINSDFFFKDCLQHIMICNSSYLEKESARDPFSATMLSTKLKRRKHFEN